MQMDHPMNADSGRAAQRDMAPTPAQLAAIRRTIRRTAFLFNQRLLPECVADLVQEVLLRLWKWGVEEKLNEHPGYVRRVAANVTIDELRRRSAKKRNPYRAQWRAETFLSQLPRTPEEILLEREEE